MHRESDFDFWTCTFENNPASCNALVLLISSKIQDVVVDLWDGDGSSNNFALSCDPEHGIVHVTVTPDGGTTQTVEASIVGTDEKSVLLVSAPPPNSTVVVRYICER